MCQLTFININRKENKYFLYSQLLFNTRINHQEGTGFFQKGNEVYKAKEKPSDIIDLVDIIDKNINNLNPIIGHVRQASNRTTISKENAHPFETDKIIFAHNGTLTPKNKLDIRKYEKDKNIDSEIFAIELSKRYNEDIVLALNNTMKYFTGPFAFLIYSKVTNKYYAARGETKLLHISYLSINDKPIGYIINTEKDDLVSSLNKIKNSYMLLNIGRLIFTEPQILEVGSIFELNEKGPKKIGDIKENYIPIFISSRDVYDEEFGRNIYTTLNKEDKEKEQTVYNSILEFALKTSLSLEELDLLFYRTIGIGLAYLTQDDINTFHKYILRGIKGYWDNGKKMAWSLIIKESKLKPIDIYEKYTDISFPYFMTSKQKLVEIARIIVIQKKEENKKLNLIIDNITKGVK